MNFLFQLYLKYKRERFDKSFLHIEALQQQVLTQIIAQSKETKFFHSKCVSTINEFWERIPLHTYADLKNYIEADKEDFNRNIVSHKPLRWEKTSGPSGQSKSIAYTKKQIWFLLEYLIIWFLDVILNGPKLSSKKNLLFIVSPHISK